MTNKDLKKQYIKEFGYSSFNKYNKTDYSKWLEKQLIYALNEVIKLGLHGVNKSVATKYAEFCVRCDREGLPLLELDGYIKQYCC